MTGILSGISGVVQEPLYETTKVEGVNPYGIKINSSGIRKGGDSLKLKKNYIYYLGERI